MRWRTQDQEGAQLRDELRQAAKLWEQHGRSTDRLWTGTAVKEFQIWRERYPGRLTESEQDFTLAMVQQAGRRRKRMRLAIAATFGVLMGVVALIGALWQRSEAARDDAAQEARRAEASKLLALGQLELDDYPTSSVAYAIASLELADTPESRRLALEALWRGPAAFVVSEESTWDAAFSPDDRCLIQSRGERSSPP